MSAVKESCFRGEASCYILIKDYKNKGHNKTRNLHYESKYDRFWLHCVLGLFFLSIIHLETF